MKLINTTSNDIDSKYCVCVCVCVCDNHRSLLSLIIHSAKIYITHTKIYLYLKLHILNYTY